MNLRNPNDVVEELVHTVGRAFYTDEVIVVLDALFRERYIREKELGPRLKLPDKSVTKAIVFLESEMLIKSEIIRDENADSKCYYIGEVPPNF